jgi:hypothetical protein
MKATVMNPLQRLGISWLLGALLLLPISQFAASWHRLSHLAAGSATSPDDHGLPHDVACSICLAATVLDHAGPLAEPTPIAEAEPAPLPAPDHADATWHRAPLAVYRSRAPPVVLH